MVLVGAGPGGERVGNPRVLTSETLVPYLSSLTDRRLEYARAREVFARLAPLAAQAGEPA